MLRGKTARSAARLLAAVLLTLQFFAPSASFASAHTPRQAEAKAEPGNDPTGTPVRDESVTHRGCGLPGDPADPLRRHERFRAGTAVSTPLTADRPSRGVSGPMADRPATPPTASHHPARTWTAHSSALLQVFRC